jgi:hypothetical protein
MNKLTSITTPLVKAQEIMGDFCFGPEIVKKHFGVSFTGQELRGFQQVPFTESTLKACSSTHILALGADISISEMVESKWELFDDHVYSSYYHQPSYFENDHFVKNERVGKKWMLMNREYVHKSRGKDWNSQLKLVGSKEIIPRACEFIYIAALTFLEIGKGILDPLYIRTNDQYSHGYHVCVRVCNVSGYKIGIDVLIDGAEPNAYGIITLCK